MMNDEPCGGIVMGFGKDILCSVGYKVWLLQIYGLPCVPLHLAVLFWLNWSVGVRFMMKPCQLPWVLSVTVAMFLYW